jgi:hypothetical protein
LLSRAGSNVRAGRGGGRRSGVHLRNRSANGRHRRVVESLMSR